MQPRKQDDDGETPELSASPATTDVILMRMSFDLPETVFFVPHLRKTCRCLAESLGVSCTDADDVELMVGELATNAVRHARGGGYRVEVEFFDKRSVVTVIDRGVGFSPDQLPAPGTARPSDLDEEPEGRMGGWGLPLVYSLADDVQITTTEPQGTTVRVEKVFQ